MESRDLEKKVKKYSDDVTGGPAGGGEGRFVDARTNSSGSELL